MENLQGSPLGSRPITANASPFAAAALHATAAAAAAAAREIAPELSSPVHQPSARHAGSMVMATRTAMRPHRQSLPGRHSGSFGYASSADFGGAATGSPTSTTSSMGLLVLAAKLSPGVAAPWIQELRGAGTAPAVPAFAPAIDAVGAGNGLGLLGLQHSHPLHPMAALKP